MRALVVATVLVLIAAPDLPRAGVVAPRHLVAPGQTHGIYLPIALNRDIPSALPRPTERPSATASPSSTPSPTPTDTTTPMTPPPRPSDAPPPENPRLAVLDLPALTGSGPCDGWVEVQNLGDIATKVGLVTWSQAAACFQDCAPPLGVECSGLIKPGSTWSFSQADLPTEARSAVAFSLNTRLLSQYGLGMAFGFDEEIAQLFCESLRYPALDDCDSFSHFRKVFEQGGLLGGLPADVLVGEPIVARVQRDCYISDDGRRLNLAYNGIGWAELGNRDAESGVYTYYVPAWFAQYGGWDTILSAQNAGPECATAELWLLPAGQDGQPTACGQVSLPPGASRRLVPPDCAAQAQWGSAWITSTQPLGVVVDHTGGGMLSEAAHAADLRPFEPRGGQPANHVLYGPLVYLGYQGWDSVVYVMNVSPRPGNAKLYVMDFSGDIIATQVADFGPRATWQVDLSALGQTVRSVAQVRVESREVPPEGGQPVRPPATIVGAVHLVRRVGVHDVPDQAASYELLREQEAFDWPVGSGRGGTHSGVGAIAVPRLRNYQEDEQSLGTSIALANLVVRPGFTDLVMYIHDQNGLLDYVCEKLNEKQVRYIDLNTWGYVNPGFTGSAVISTVFWEHPVIGERDEVVRNLVGLGAVVVEKPPLVRSGLQQGRPVDGLASHGIPLRLVPPHRAYPGCRSGPPPLPTRPAPGRE